MPLTCNFADDELPGWERVEPPIWWGKANAFVIADRFLPDGTRQHIVSGHVETGTVIANANVFGQMDLEYSHLKFAETLSHLSKSPAPLVASAELL